jgi:ferredoxin-like protein FixX
MAHLQRFCYWLQMKEILTKYVKGCVMCSTCNPTNRKMARSDFQWPRKPQGEIRTFSKVKRLID